MPELAYETEMRSAPGEGEPVLIYVLGRAEENADSVVPNYGAISAGCGPNRGEDFSKARWPVVVKVKPGVPDGDLIQHLRDLADNINKATQEEGVEHIVAPGGHRLDVWLSKKAVIARLEAHSDRADGMYNLPPDLGNFADCALRDGNEAMCRAALAAVEQWYDDWRQNPPMCPRCGQDGQYGHHRLCRGNDGTSPGILDTDLKTVIDWVNKQCLVVIGDGDIPF